MPNDLDSFLTLAGAIIGVGAYIYTWLTYRHAANTESIAALKSSTDEEINALNARISHVEGQTQSAQASWNAVMSGQSEMRTEMSKIHQRVDEVAQSTANVSGQLTQIGRSLDMLLKNKIDE